MDALPEFLAESVNPFLLGVLVPLPWVGARKGGPWRFYAACGLGIGVAVTLAELGKARVVWAGHPGFPSGHETFAAAAATCLVCWDRRWAWLAVPTVAAMGWALVESHYHTPEDIAGAVVLGPTVAWLCHWLLGRATRDAPSQ